MGVDVATQRAQERGTLSRSIRAFTASRTGENFSASREPGDSNRPVPSQSTPENCLLSLFDHLFFEITGKAANILKCIDEIFQNRRNRLFFTRYWAKKAKISLFLR